MADFNTEMENQAKKIFREGSQTLQAPPFLAARVAQEHAFRSAMQMKKWWRKVAFGSVGASVALACLLAWFVLMPAVFKAEVGQSTLVEVSLRQVRSSELARIEVHLPEGVTFVSERFPEIHGQRSISVPIAEGQSLDGFPFVVRSVEAGVKQIHVSVFDRNGKLTEKKVLRIRFTKS